MKAVPIWEITYGTFFGNRTMILPAETPSKALGLLEEHLNRKEKHVLQVSTVVLNEDKRFLASGEEGE